MHNDYDMMATNKDANINDKLITTVAAPTDVKMTAS